MKNLKYFLDKNKYDFSWISEEVSKWPEELRTPENAKRLPFGIFWWVDLTGGVFKTHLNEPIDDISEYLKQREDWIDKNIKGL